MTDAAELRAPPRLAVGAVVVARAPGGDGLAGVRVALVRRARPPLQGAWSLPGGRVEAGERLVDAVRREVREEIGLEVRVGDLIEVVEIVEPPFHYVILDYACEPEGGVLSPGDDAAEVVMAPVDDLPRYQLTDVALRVIERAVRRVVAPG